jgi:hypothetical protein
MTTEFWRHADGSIRQDHMDAREDDYFGHLVTTDKRRFVHRRRFGETNTVCGAMPEYYKGHGLVRVTDAEAARLHRCKRCFRVEGPDGPQHVPGQVPLGRM